MTAGRAWRWAGRGRGDGGEGEGRRTGHWWLGTGWAGKMSEGGRGCGVLMGVREGTVRGRGDYWWRRGQAGCGGEERERSIVSAF